MAGLKNVGPSYSADNNSSDLLTKGDVDAAFANAAVSQITVQSAINTAVAGMASQSSVNLALNAFIESNSITNAEQLLIPLTQIGAAGGVAPLDNSGKIPSQFVPSLGVGYCSGPFGPTQTFPGSTGVQPVKIADWGINWGTAGGPGFAFQPVVFMSLLAGAGGGGRPVIEVRMSAGPATYANQTLISRGVGRNSWNDLQTINVLPTPSGPGHTGVAGTGYSATYNAWISAWLYDANNQAVTVSTGNFAIASAYFLRYQS
jgi:hypothetical protein